jgi:DNA-binding NarL/FixJ family response regulator
MRVLLVDDHALFRDGLALLLHGLHDPLEVVHAASAEQASSLVQAGAQPDLVLLDLRLPGVEGAAAVRAMCALCPNAPVVVISGECTEALVRDCVEAGALGYIHKSADAGALLRALRTVIDGGVHLPPLPAAPAAPGAAVANLTPRQRQVVALMIRGHSNKAIAQQLGILETTVKSHVTAVLQTLGARNRTQAVFALHDVDPTLLR